MTTRSEILRVATDLFGTRGFHAVGMRAIATEVGLRGSSLYHHFASKTDLLFAIALDATRDFIDAQMPALDADGSPAARLKSLVGAHIRYFWEHRAQEAVALDALAELEPHQRKEIHDQRVRYQERVIALIEEGREEGQFDIDDPRLATLAMLGMISSVNTWYKPSGRLTIEQIADSYAIYIVDRLLGADKPAEDA